MAIAAVATFNLNDTFGALPGDTLRTDTGEIIIVPDYGIPGVDYADSQFIASFLPGYLTLPDSLSEAPLSNCTVDDSLESILLYHHVYYVEQVFRGSLLGDTVRVVDSATIVIPDVSQIYILYQHISGDVLGAIEDIYTHSATRFGEPNFFVETQAEPFDPFWNHETMPQWNLKNPYPGGNPPTYGIGCPTAWDYGAGSTLLRMGIVDTGVNATHLDLGGPNYPNEKVMGGWNYADWNNSVGDADDSPDGRGHGTGTAGIAAALTNNTVDNEYFGMAGIAGGWNSEQSDKGIKLAILKVRSDNGGMPDDVAANAIRLGSLPGISDTTFGCQILNCSITGGANDIFEPAVLTAYQLNTSVIAAKGNLGTGLGLMPASINHRNWVIAVGSYGKDGKYCSINHGNCETNMNYGKGLDILAPGVDIPYTAKTGEVTAERGGGTSYATPQVSGAIALLRSSDSNWGIPFQLRNEDYEWILKYSAYDPTAEESDDISDGDEWTLNDYYGHGQLRISTPIERLTNPEWSLTAHTATGGFVTEISSGNHIFHSPTLPPDDYLEGTYWVQRYTVRVNVNYPLSFIDTPYVWGIGHGTKGWSGSSPNYQVGWCRLVPDMQRIDGCILETFVYKVYQQGPGGIIILGWYPCAPRDVSLNYRLWGIQGTPPKVSTDFLPGEISLRGNYPNPFNSSTSITLYIPAKSPVVLAIYDLLGRRVNTLIDKEVLAGEHSVSWNGKDELGNEVSSGIYFSKLEAGDQVQITKMTMLK